MNSLVRHGVGLFCILLGAAADCSSEPATQPVEQYWFVRAQRHHYSGRPRKHIISRLDPVQGKEVVIRDTTTPDREIVMLGLADVAGRLPLFGFSYGSYDITGGPNYLAVSREEMWADAPVQAFEQYGISWFSTCALSPEGKTIAVYDPDYGRSRNDPQYKGKGGMPIEYGPESQAFFISQRDTALAIPTAYYARKLSWSPDSKKVAFYYAKDCYYDDHHIQQHGVAVLSVDGKLEIVVPDTALPATGGHETCKEVPVAWGPDSNSVYFTAGLSADDPEADSPRAAHSFGRRVVTYKVDVQTRQIEKISLGALADISPDGSYLLLCPHPTLDRSGKCLSDTAKYTVSSKEVTILPSGIYHPRISPDGSMIATDYGRFYRTKDWKQYGQKVALEYEQSVTAEVWHKNFRWVKAPLAIVDASK